jgi:hypothetical protein
MTRAEGDAHEGGWLTVGAAAEGGEGDEEGVSDGSGPKISCSYRIVLCISRFCFFVNAKILHRATHLLGLYQLSMSYPSSCRLRVSFRRYHCHKITTKNCSRTGVAVQVSSMLLRRFASTSTLPPTIRQLLSSPQPASQETKVQLSGWIKSVRRQKNVTFAVINDGSCASGLQAVLKPDATPHKYVLKAFWKMKVHNTVPQLD